MLLATLALPANAQGVRNGFIQSCVSFYGTNETGCNCVLETVDDSLSSPEITFLRINMDAETGFRSNQSGPSSISDDRIPVINEILQAAANNCLPQNILLKEGFENG